MITPKPCFGRYDGVGLEPGKGMKDLLPDSAEDELDDDNGPEDRLISLQKRGMALPLEIKGQHGEALCFVVLFTEKMIQEEDTA